MEARPPRPRRVLKPRPSSLLQALSVAGLGAGLTEAVVVNPFEVVKVSLQANRDAFKEVVGHKSPATRLCELHFISAGALCYSNPPRSLKQDAS